MPKATECPHGASCANASGSRRCSATRGMTPGPPTRTCSAACMRSASAGGRVSPGETVRNGVVALGPVRIGYHGDDEPMTIERAPDLTADLRAAIIKAEEIEAWSRQHD
jgi:hypothetical protein